MISVSRKKNQSESALNVEKTLALAVLSSENVNKCGITICEWCLSTVDIPFNFCEECIEPLEDLCE